MVANSKPSHPSASTNPKHRPKDGKTQVKRHHRPSPSSSTSRLSKTRVCIKNLPPKTTEQDLKAFLLSGGTGTTTKDKQRTKGRQERLDGATTAEPSLLLQITDCRVLRTAGGKSRNVAFVGFRTSGQAALAVSTFHRTYLNMTRITVEAAVAKGGDDDVGGGNDTSNKAEGPAPAAASPVHDDGGGGDKKRGTNSKSDPEKKTKAVDDKVEEFLNLMGGGKKSKFWSNDDDANVRVAASEAEEKINESVNDGNEDEDEDEDSSRSSSSSSSEDDDENDNDEHGGNGGGDQMKEETARPSNPSALSDLDFLRSKQTRVNDFDDDQEDSPGPENDEGSKHPVDRKDGDDDQDDSDSSSTSSSDWSSDDAEDGKTAPMSTTPEIAQHSEAKLACAKNENDKKGADHSGDGDDDDDDDDDQIARAATQPSKTRLFVRNLPFETTEEELEEYFSPFGKVMECHIPVDDQKRNKGYAFVTYEVAVDAIQAKNQLDKVDFQGRLLHILESRPPPALSPADASNDQHLTWKQKQELARKEADTKKAAAGESARGWSASFVRGDAVVDNLAERLGLRKGDLLGVKDKLSSGDAAVRLALGETQIIEENREYFRLHGVDMEALVSANGDGDENGKTKRSKTAILVKNLPFDTKLEELTKLFHVGAEPVNILLPPSRTIAMVEYGHSTDAKRAFRNLAYRRFKHVPIYLEWAPLNASTGPANSTKATLSNASTEPSTDPASPSSSRPITDAEPDMVDEEEVETETAGDISATLYVKNLNFGTTEDVLQQMFESHVGKVLSVRIPRKVGPTKDGSEGHSQSMGYGFVELASHAVAKGALRTLQGKLVDGHALELALSSQQRASQTAASASSSAAAAAAAAGKKPPTKLMVRNVPFQATRQELLKLFGSFGQLRKVRLPKKFDGSHRGFAFVEFLTGKEAAAAMAALSRTHLYGRRLVLEWASNDGDDDDVERLRDKAKRDAAPSQVVPKNKKIRFD